MYPAPPMSRRQGSEPVLVSGATGLVGARFCEAWAADAGPVRALTRNAKAAEKRLRGDVAWVEWDGIEPPEAALAECSAVVHLAGEPVFAGRLDAARRRRIRNSRIDSTEALVRKLAGLPAAQRPRSLVCASAVGYYGDRGDEELPETAAAGSGFLADVCRDWEAAARGAEAHGVRVVRLRIGIVLAREGGALPRMALPFRAGVGGRLGSGHQWFPWIQLDDLVALLRTVLEDGGIEGAVNATAPNPVRNSELTRSLGRVLHRPALVPVPAFALRLALGELAEEVLGSRRVLPERALAGGFAFAHPQLEAALRHELG
jgi:uncharacterized protein (TIGR01777 family)